ncbi:MAG: hypothetical protein C5B50_17750 [Verrucomicrobia bacterium]|nr:MAG: hypothetical protein C5B50_17750 [Verrucomicrobiota bacterium]
MLYERWRQIAKGSPERIALQDLAHGQKWTFSELADIVEKSEPGNSEAIVFPQGNSGEFVITVLRSWRSGHVVCPLEPGQVPPKLAGAPDAGIVHLKTTSATTGTPRLVTFTARQLMADADNIVATMGLRPDWPNLGVISLAHSYGFSNLVLALLLHGIPLILAHGTPRSADSAVRADSGSNQQMGGEGCPPSFLPALGVLPEALRSAAASAPAITLAAVPALWQAWHEAKVIPSNVRLAISAGAPLPLSLEKAIYITTGLKVHNFYGSSECGGIAYDATTVPRNDDLCAGTPLRGVQVSVTDDGCLEVRGKAVAESYWPEPSHNLGEGCLVTADLAEIRDGQVYLLGRASDQINVAGRKVLPQAIEHVLALHPQVRDCLAFGVSSSNGQRGDTIVACVVTNETVSGEELRQFALTNLPAWQVPRKWWFVESLSVNSRGKLSRAEWRKRFLESGLSKLI